MPSPFTTLLAWPFRLFFLLTGLYAIAVVAYWGAAITGHLPLPANWPPLYWHSHEMLFGLVPTAVAGFVLTAVCNWTGAPPLQGRGLLMLGLLWLAGRLAMLSSLSPPWMALIDLLFLFALASFLARVLLRYGNKRNLMLAGIVALLGLANLAMHLGAINGDMRWLISGETLALNLITLLMVIIGGRIIPAFSRNWLRLHGGRDGQVKTCPKLEMITLVSTALLIPAELLAPWLNLSGVVLTLAILAAFANGVRLARWRGWLTAPEPLLWILHLGYLWLVLALVFKALVLAGLVPPSTWQHALGTGAMGTLILAVMTRVALGHTGRPLRLPRFGQLIYLAITLAVVLRMAVAMQWLPFQAGIMLSVAAWVLAFGSFTLLYWPVLSRPRVDGRPG